MINHLSALGEGKDSNDLRVLQHLLDLREVLSLDCFHVFEIRHLCYMVVDLESMRTEVVVKFFTGDIIDRCVY